MTTEYKEGQSVLYLDAVGQKLVPAVVVQRDDTVTPPQYGVRLAGSESVRFTETTKLRPVGATGPGASPTLAHGDQQRQTPGADAPSAPRRYPAVPKPFVDDDADVPSAPPLSRSASDFFDPANRADAPAFRHYPAVPKPFVDDDADVPSAPPLSRSASDFFDPANRGDATAVLKIHRREPADAFVVPANYVAVIDALSGRYGGLLRAVCIVSTGARLLEAPEHRSALERACLCLPGIVCSAANGDDKQRLKQLCRCAYTFAAYAPERHVFDVFSATPDLEPLAVLRLARELAEEVATDGGTTSPFRAAQNAVLKLAASFAG